jgi:hypothetical protein
MFAEKLTRSETKKKALEWINKGKKYLFTCKRLRSIGYNAKSCTENKMNAKTDRSSDKREANTTDDDIAAFKDSTEVNLISNVWVTFYLEAVRFL